MTLPHMIKNLSSGDALIGRKPSNSLYYGMYHTDYFLLLFFFAILIPS